MELRGGVAYTRDYRIADALGLGKHEASKRDAATNQKDAGADVALALG